MLPETHKLKSISQDITLTRGETDRTTFEKLRFDVFPAMIKSLNLFVLKSRWTTHEQAHKRDSDPTHTTQAPSPSLHFSFPHPFKGVKILHISMGSHLLNEKTIIPTLGLRI